MRIAFFVTYFPKLSEVFLLNQVLALLDRGHDVHLFALSDPVEANIQPGSERLLDEARAHIGRMPRGNLARLALLPDLFAGLPIRESLRCLNMVRDGTEAVSLRNLFRLDAIKGERLEFDVAHAQFGNVARQCVMLRELDRLKAPLVTSFRGNDLSKYVRHARPSVYKSVFRESAFCMPVARRWKETLLSLGCPAEKIRPLPSGIPMSKVPVRSLDGWGEGEFPRIISACRLEKYKGVHLGLEAFRLLLDRFPKARYEIFGDGPERVRLQARANRLGIGGHVTWYGATSHARVMKALAECDLHWFTTLSLEDGRTEGVPNILKETQSAGLPALAFGHPGVDEVLDGGETGVVVPEGDVRALADETAKLAADATNARLMGERARLTSRERFDLGRITDRLEQIYASAMSA